MEYTHTSLILTMSWYSRWNLISSVLGELGCFLFFAYSAFRGELMSPQCRNMIGLSRSARPHIPAPLLAFSRSWQACSPFHYLCSATQSPKLFPLHLSIGMGSLFCSISCGLGVGVCLWLCFILFENGLLFLPIRHWYTGIKHSIVVRCWATERTTMDQIWLRQRAKKCTR